MFASHFLGPAGRPACLLALARARPASSGQTCAISIIIITIMRPTNNKVMLAGRGPNCRLGGQNLSAGSHLMETIAARAEPSVHSAASAYQLAASAALLETEAACWRRQPARVVVDAANSLQSTRPNSTGRPSLGPIHHSDKSCACRGRR